MLSRVLRFLFAQDRIGAIHIWLHRFGGAIIAAIVLTAVGGLFFQKFNPKQPTHIHDAYFTGSIRGIISGNSGLIVDVTLLDGTPLRFNVIGQDLKRSLVDTACVERRKFTATGKFTHLLSLPQNCNIDD